MFLPILIFHVQFSSVPCFLAIYQIVQCQEALTSIYLNMLPFCSYIHLASFIE